MLELDADTGDAAVRALHERLVGVSDGITDAPNFLRELEHRMRLAPVCIAEDIALPHARTNAVTRLVLGVARMRRPIPFDATHPAVRLVFLIGTPKDAVTGYLQAVESGGAYVPPPARAGSRHSS